MQADTTLFQTSHGRQPRGFGRWGFQVGEETFFVVGQYSDAKRKAFHVAQTRGESRVVVLPEKRLAPQGATPERPGTMSQEQIDFTRNRLMAQAEPRTFRKGKRGQRERLAVPVKGLSAAQVRAVFGVESDRTSHAIVRRGFFIVNYTKPRQCPSANLTAEFAAEAYRIANWWFYKKLAGRVPHWADGADMIQEAVTRLIELAGDPKMKSGSFKFYVVRTTMAEYLRRNQRHEHLDEEQIDAPKSRGGAWCRAHLATETLCQLVEARASRREAA
jgi:hypothetical protein